MEPSAHSLFGYEKNDPYEFIKRDGIQCINYNGCIPPPQPLKPSRAPLLAAITAIALSVLLVGGGGIAFTLTHNAPLAGSLVGVGLLVGGIGIALAVAYVVKQRSQPPQHVAGSGPAEGAVCSVDKSLPPNLPASGSKQPEGSGSGEKPSDPVGPGVSEKNRSNSSQKEVPLKRKPSQKNVTPTINNGAEHGFTGYILVGSDYYGIDPTIQKKNENQVLLSELANATEEDFDLNTFFDLKDPQAVFVFSDNCWYNASPNSSDYKTLQKTFTKESDNYMLSPKKMTDLNENDEAIFLGKESSLEILNNYKKIKIK